MNIREFALNRAFAEALPRPTTVQAAGNAATKTIVLIDEPGIRVTEQPGVPEAFLSPEEKTRKQIRQQIEQDPLPNIGTIIAHRYDILGVEPPEYIE